LSERADVVTDSSCGPPKDLRLACARHGAR